MKTQLGLHGHTHSKFCEATSGLKSFLPNLPRSALICKVTRNQKGLATTRPRPLTITHLATCAATPWIALEALEQLVQTGAARDRSHLG
jgi:hypothetical protein